MARKVATEPEDKQQGLNGIERALDVLVLFSNSDSPTLGVTEIAAELALSKAVVHRLLTTFRARGFVEIDPETHRYRLGPEIGILGLSYLDRIDLRSLGHEVLVSLVALTNETATMSVLVGSTRIYLDQVTPNRDVKMMVQLGRPFPLHARRVVEGPARLPARGRAGGIPGQPAPGRADPPYGDRSGPVAPGTGEHPPGGLRGVVRRARRERRLGRRPRLRPHRPPGRRPISLRPGRTLQRRSSPVFKRPPPGHPPTLPPPRLPLRRAPRAGPVGVGTPRPGGPTPCRPPAPARRVRTCR